METTALGAGGNVAAISQATISQVPSLSTILARSFHPVNPYIKRCIPDTPAVRDWWSSIFTDAIEDDYCYVLTATGPTADDVVGTLLLRHMGIEQEGSGMWTKHDLTADHDAAAYWPMVIGMGEAHHRLMRGNTNMLIELLAVDHAYKRKGIGQRLLEEACKLASGGGYDIFVQANANAKSFYRRQGFEAKERRTMPGEEGS